MYSNYFIKAIISLTFIVVMGLLLSSCTNSDIAGLAIQPPRDALNVISTDTNSLITRTVREDSLLTSELFYITSFTSETDTTRLNLLGNYIDPVFGKTEASFYTQFALGDGRINFDSANFTIDSLMLRLSYNTSYGDTQNLQNLNVYELKQAIQLGNNYSSSDISQNQLTLIGSKSYFPSTSDSSQLSVRLSTLESKFLINKTKLADQNSFLSFFNGIYLKTDDNLVSGQGAISSFNLQIINQITISPYTKAVNNRSVITMYYSYSYTKADKQDTTIKTSFNFVVNANCARGNHFSHDYSGTPIASSISNPLNGDSLVYLQGMAGTKVKIVLPNLNKYFNKGYIINKAELIISPQDGSETIYSPPSRLYVAGIGDNGESFFIRGGGVGGYNSTSKQYSIIITQHVQQLVNGRLNNNGLYLQVDAGTVLANRAVIMGGKHSGNRMKLLLTYTKI